MVNINSKRWEDVESEDIRALLSRVDDETFFFEFKADDESPKKLMNEISAFANTYGGYVFLGVKNDKTVEGCKVWNEQRIHTSIHDSITPTPNFDVRKFNMGEDCDIFVIKVEQGNMPPYITGEGKIYERLSSGSFTVRDSAKLSHLYIKHQDELKKIRNKIELPELDRSASLPTNVCGYLDMGFYNVCSEKTNFQKSYDTFDYTLLSKYISSNISDFSISRVGLSLYISLGNVSAHDSNGNRALLDAGLNNFIEIMPDGSVRTRIIFSSYNGTNNVDINSISFTNTIFKEIYKIIFGEDFFDIFVYALRYEQLTVIKQFIPGYNLKNNDEESAKEIQEYILSHNKRYGNNLIITSDRFPKNDYEIIDKRLFATNGWNYTFNDLLDVLFSSFYMNLGYID